jgi:nuclear pore complex protein Nup98-Nup96
MFGAPAPGGYGGYGAPAPGGYGAPPPSGGMFGAPAPAPGGYGGYYGAQAPAASQPMPAAPAVGSIMPPATDEILTAQLTALENKRREIEKSDNFRGKPSESSSIYGLSLSEQQGLVSLTPVRASYPAYRASPRSSAKIRPRGFASPEKTTTPSLSRLGTGGRPMAAPDSLAASSVTRLVINPSPKPKMRLALDASTPAKESPLQITNQPSFSMEPLSFNRATEQTPETPKANETTPAEESKSQSNGGVSHDYYKQVLSSPDEAAGISTPAKKNVAPTLSKKGYTCTPSIQELQSMLPEDLAAVPGFSVERPGVGMIEWEGAVDVRGVNLDTLVLIDDDPQSASVYTQEEKEGTKPPVGTKLNRPAIITLERMFPPANASSEKFARKVAKSTKKNHAELIKYDASTGEWKFRVLHFSRYALADDDSETESENDQNFESGERGGRSRAVKGIMKEREGSPYQSSVAFVVSSEEDEEDAGLQHRVDDESKLFTDAESAFEHMQLALKDKISGGILKKKEEIADFPEEVEGDSEMKENDRYVPGMEDFQDALSRGGICSSIAQESGVKSSSVDFGSRMGKSFRVGWAPDGSFLCLKPGGILSRRKPVFCHRSKEHAQLLERHHENACKVAIADETCPQFSLPMSTSDKPSLQKALKSYADSNDSLDHKGEEAAVASQAFSLLKCLLDSGEDNDEDKSLGAREEASNEHILEVRRIHAVTLWLVKSCSHEVDEEIKVSNARNDTCAALLAAVTGGDVEKACSVAEGLGFFQLSTMLASRPDARNDVLRQVLNWTDSGATSIIPKELLRIYFLIGGDSKMEEDIYRKKYSPFDWRRRLAMRLVYEASTLHENLSSLIQEYEEKFSSGVAPYPQPQYLSSSSKDEIQCVLYRLLRFGKHEFEISLREIVDPVGHTSFVHDFSLSFHLAAAISAMDCSSPLSAVEEQNLIEGYTAQLITQGNWEWAVYVSLCRLRASEPNAWKAKKAKSLVIQNYREDSSNAEKRRQFLEGAGVPSAWFEEALALRCATDGDSYGYLNHMVQVSTDETCTTLEKVLIPNMLFMNKENLDESLKLLEVFAVDESSLACAVYNFFQLYRSILSLEGATRAEIDASMPTLMESCKSIEQVFVTYKGEEERVQGPALRFAPTVVPISSFLAEGLSQISLFKLQLKALQSGISISSTASQILNLSQPLPHEFKETGLSARENICRWLM